MYKSFELYKPCTKFSTRLSRCLYDDLRRGKPKEKEAYKNYIDYMKRLTVPNTFAVYL